MMCRMFDDTKKMCREVCCEKCKKEQSSHSCQDITALGRCAIEHEQKLADKVEPKFKVGDWIINSQGTLRHIINVDKGGYQTDGGWLSHDTYEKTFHLWTIQDAKLGDVLVCKGNIKYSNGIKYKRICLFNNLGNAFFTLTKISNCVEDYGIDVNIDYPSNTVPATKEQKEILLMTMKHARYTFDFEKKELKKIEQKAAAWSEKDEIMKNYILQEWS